MRNLDSLKETIVNMELGDVIELTFLYKNEWSEEMDEMCTMLTKTRWFDSYTYILGGATDEVIAIKADNPRDINEQERVIEAQNVINEIIKHAEPDDMIFKNEGNTVKIHAYGGCLSTCEWDNIVYRK